MTFLHREGDESDARGERGPVSSPSVTSSTEVGGGGQVFTIEGKSLAKQWSIKTHWMEPTVFLSSVLSTPMVAYLILRWLLKLVFREKFVERPGTPTRKPLNIQGGP